MVTVRRVRASRSSLTDLSEIPVIDVEDEAANLGRVDEGAVDQRRHGCAHVGVDAAKGTESKGRANSRTVFDLHGQRFFLERFQAATSVVDHHDGPSTQESLTEQQRANSVFAGQATGVADQMGFAEIEPERAEEIQS